MKYIAGLCFVLAYCFSSAFALDLVFLGELTDNPDSYIEGTSYAFAGSYTHVYYTEEDCGDTIDLIGQSISIDSLGTRKGLNCIEKQCECMFIKDSGGPIIDDICFDQLTYPAQLAWETIATGEVTNKYIPKACAVEDEEEEIDPTEGGFPRADTSGLSEIHKDYAKNLARRLRYFDKEYIKNFFLYVLELL